MTRHLFTLVWNRKWRSLLIILEIFLSFCVVFAVAGVLIFRYANYFKPLGFSYDQVYALRPSWAAGVPMVKMTETMKELKLKLESIPEVEMVAMTRNNVPFKEEHNEWTRFESNGKVDEVLKWTVDDNFARVLAIDIHQGRWFNKTDDASRSLPIVITENLAKKFFPSEDPLGKIVKVMDKNRRIIGVAGNYRNGLFSDDTPAFFERQNVTTLSDVPLTEILIMAKSSPNVSLEDRIARELTTVNDTGEIASHELATLDLLRTYALRGSYLPLLILAIVFGFLIFNVIMGLFGVLWLNINQRRSELGLRRAVGALSTQIYKQVLAEALILATFGIAPGFLFAIQIPLLNVLSLPDNSIYFKAALIAALSLYLLVIACAIYPSRQAMKIQPADVLHE